jgi:hypothetical protein
MRIFILTIFLNLLLVFTLFAQANLEISNDIVVETTNTTIEIDGDLTETGTGYVKGKISSGSRPAMTTFAGFTLSSALNGAIVRNTGSVYPDPITNFLRYYELTNSGSAVTADLQSAYVGSGTYDERNSLASPYYLYKYATVWHGFGDGSSSSPITAANLLVNTGSSDWVLSDGSFVTFDDTETATTGSTISFNENIGDGDGRKIEMNFSSLVGSGNVTVLQNNHAPVNAPCFCVCGFQWEISKVVGITSFTVDITFYYHETDVIGFTETAAFLGIAKYNASTNTWQWLGGTVDGDNNTVTISGVTSFSTFALFRRIFGDITGDGYVDAADLQRLGDCWHQTNSGEFTAGCDGRFFNFNKNTDVGNQIIDAADLQVFGDCWHNGVPE